MTESMTYWMNNFYLITTQLMMMIFISLPSKKNKFHPINLMMILISLTIMLILKMNYLMKSWTPFFLFLIMIGGLFIILIYIISLTNNNFLKLNFSDIILTSLKMFLSLMLMFMLMKMQYLFNNEIMSSIIIFNPNKFNMSNLFNYNSNFSFFLMNYLFFSMMCIMNICNKYKSPIRQLYLYE